ncbi:D-alanyl-D-alanine carboxypeptidase/D-alanyl-D-alanine-endopeptidase [Rubrivirga sp. IMCC45206]|uniref:D-alanyl-D-alanine carboxypeptidase/D-alanyl-D-alanine endopeptidase n=1 Tax=Rubrivirga sp. IMCC45206 TaxID=3391614 RepID=UPI00398FF741
MPLVLRPLAALAVALFALAAAAQPTSTVGGLADRIDEVLDARAFDDAYWGAYVVDLTTGEELFARNAQRRFIPASNMKIVATAAALDQLGPAFTYKTRLYADGPIQNGTLLGGLVVRGAGDPTFGGRFRDGDALGIFREWADSLRALGVRRIQGPIVGDDDVFDNVHLGQGWQWDDLKWYYGAEISGLQFQEGTVHVEVRGTTPGQRARITASPDYGYVRFANQTTTTDGGSIQEGYDRALSDNVFTVSARVPAGRTETEDLSIVNPTDYFVSTLIGVLRDQGIDVVGEGVDVDEWGRRPRYERLTRVATHTSPSLAAIVEQTNTDSNNLYAEHLLRTLGAYVYRGADLPTGSAFAGWEAAKPFMLRIGVDPETFRVADGSGLSALNRVTPVGIVGILRGMYQHPDRATKDAFWNSLPVGGYTGTLRNRYRGGDARGNVRAKTGYISGARTLSGYVTSASGHVLAFSLLCNNYTVRTSRVNQAQDQIVELLADFEGR